MITEKETELLLLQIATLDRRSVTIPDQFTVKTWTRALTEAGVSFHQATEAITHHFATPAKDRFFEQCGTREILANVILLRQKKAREAERHYIAPAAVKEPPPADYHQTFLDSLAEHREKKAQELAAKARVDA